MTGTSGMRGWAAVMLTFITFCSEAQAWQTSQPAKAAELVEKLGDASQASRRLAREQLEAMVPQAIEAVRKGAAHQDPEIRAALP